MTVGLYGGNLPIVDAVRLEPTQPIILDAEGVSWGGVRLERLEALYVHGFRFEDPVLPPADPACDWSLWQVGAVIRQQTYSALYSVWARLEQMGGPRLYNPLSTEVAAFDRLGQLDRLSFLGFTVPPLLACNDDGVVAAFQRRHDGNGVVWRPVTGRAAWQHFRVRQRQALVAPDKPPVALAAIVPGRVLRAYVLDGRVVLTLAATPPERAGLERLETMIPIRDLPADRLETIGRAVAALGLRWATALVVDGETGLTFYDVDPDPEFADLPTAFATYLSEALAAALTGAPVPVAEFGDCFQERPALLLRRMLAIQFDMEQTKYAD